jgi:hypothetical protein
MNSAVTIRRVANLLDSFAPDCGCREKLSMALLRFAELETRRGSMRLLADARHRRIEIANLVDLLAELDDLFSDEPDGSAFAEAAFLFEDIGAAAAAGASDMRRLADTRQGESG